jgi:hypothetical protein
MHSAGCASSLKSEIRIPADGHRQEFQIQYTVALNTYYLTAFKLFFNNF